MRRSVEQGRLRDVVRCADWFWWVSTPSRGTARDRPQGRRILGREGGMVIRVGARQIKAETTPNYLTSAGRIWGRCGEKNERSKRQQDAQRKNCEMFNNILVFRAACNWAEGKVVRRAHGVLGAPVAEEALRS